MIHYDDIKPWGRSFAEYRSMFALTNADLERKILGCADGPASFNCAMRRLGKNVVSADPLYQFTADEIRRRIAETADDVLKQTYDNRDKFLWNAIPSIEELGKVRGKAMEEFLADYETVENRGRYVCAGLPSLPFHDNRFDLAVSSHFLFLYTDNLSCSFHVQSVGELCRVAREVRIFPILDANANRSEYVDEVVRAVESDGRTAAEVRVPYEFQKGGNVMLKITGNF